MSSDHCLAKAITLYADLEPDAESRTESHATDAGRRLSAAAFIGPPIQGLSDSGPSASGAATLARMADITARMNADQQLRLCSLVFENAAGAIMVTDERNNIIAVNQAFTHITGYTQAEVAGKNPRLLSSGRHPPEFYRTLWNTVIDTGQWQGEIWNRRKDGSPYAEWITITALFNGQGRITYYVGIFSAVTQHKLAAEHSDYLVRHDMLTGLPSRVLLEDRLSQAILLTKRDSHPVAILLLNLDRFKEINDRLGPGIGDLLLQQVAARLTARLRGIDTVVRLGKDEFVVMPHMRDVREAEQVAIKILTALTRPFIIHCHELHISASIGIGCYPGDGMDAGTLIMNAGKAMYQVKKAGGNNYFFFGRSTPPDPRKMSKPASY